MPFDNYKVGAQDASNETIAEIIALSDDLVVYLVKDGALKIDTPHAAPPAQHLPILREYDAIHTLIRRSIPRRHVVEFKKELGSAVFTALSNVGTVDPTDHFADVKNNVIERSRDFARYYYVGYGLFAGLVILAAFTFLYDLLNSGIQSLPSLGLGIVGGAIGAMASIVLRSSKLDVAPFAHWQLEALQGAVRILLGAIFGFILVAAVRGDIVLSFLDGKPFGLLIFSILAGFSEKYVPEILAGMERRPKAERRA